MKALTIMVFLVLATGMMALSAVSAATNDSTSVVTVQNTSNVSLTEISTADNSSQAPAITETTTNTTPVPALVSVAPVQTIDQEAEASLDTNESVSGMRIFWKQVGLWFTWNQEKKAQAELDLARLRLIQARNAANNNNTVAMEKALAAHDKIMTSVQAIIDRLQARNFSFNGTGLDRAIQVHEIRIEKINSMLANANLSAEQAAKVEARLSQVQNVTAHLQNVESRIEAKVAEIRSNIEAENKTINETVREGESRTISRGEWRPIIPENPTPTPANNSNASGAQ